MDERRRPRLSLDLLRGFRAAARHLSFTRAAQELSVTQSAISREIKTLEQQIGQPLFHRVHRALQLTRAGAELHRVADEALAALDEVTDRLAGSRQALGVTTSLGLASLWLAPRLPGFSRLYPEIDIRMLASCDRPDLERDDLDIAIRSVPRGDDTPSGGELLFDCDLFPVCAPALARDPARPLRTLADLAHHVRLDFETLRDGRAWSTWDFWFDALGIPPIRPVRTVRFPQYDQVVPAAIEGSGVALGARPHITHQLRDGVLCTPFGTEGIVRFGSFFVVIGRKTAPGDAVDAFIAWLRSEARRDADLVVAVPDTTRRPRAVEARTSFARQRARSGNG